MADLSIVRCGVRDFIVPAPGGAIALMQSSPNHRNIIQFPKYANIQGGAKLDAAAYCDFILPTTYTNGTGLKAKFAWRARSAVAGDVIWEVGFETLTGSTDDSAVTDWGTPTVNSASTAPATAGQVILVTISVVKANVGKGGTPVALEPMRIRIRRKGTNALDTMNDTAEILGEVNICDY